MGLGNAPIYPPLRQREPPLPPQAPVEAPRAARVIVRRDGERDARAAHLAQPGDGVLYQPAPQTTIAPGRSHFERLQLAPPREGRQTPVLREIGNALAAPDVLIVVAQDERRLDPGNGALHTHSGYGGSGGA